jgi:hypothetical protein
MKVISLLQPWASLMAAGAKRIETRSWPTAYRGEVAIAASAGIDPVVRQEFKEGTEWAMLVLKTLISPHSATFTCTAKFREAYLRDCMPRGSILCVVNLHAMVSTNDKELLNAAFADYGAEHEPNFGNYTPNRWAWVNHSCCRLRLPYRWKGSLGLRDLPPDVEADIRRQITFP